MYRFDNTAEPVKYIAQTTPQSRDLASRDLSKHPLFTHSTVSHHDFSGYRPFDREDWRASTAGGTAYAAAGYQSAIYAAAQPTQVQTFGETGYGQQPYGRPAPWSRQHPEYHYSPVNYEGSYDQTALRSTAPAAPVYRQANYSQHHPYVPFYFQSQPYQSTAGEHSSSYATVQGLTQLWQAGDDLPPTSSPPPPLASTGTADVPSNGLDGGAPSFKPRKGKSVIARDLDRIFPVDKGHRKYHSKAVNEPEPGHVLARPVPCPEYLQQASHEPKRTNPKALLVVLDLNGTLLHRPDQRNRPKTFIARPRIDEFLHYLLANHHVIIWSSAKPENVQSMCKAFLTNAQLDQLVARWARDTLRIPAHAYNTKVQSYKQLSWIWENKKIQARHPEPVKIWSQENTVLVDDSFEKAASEPYNLIKLEAFEGKKEQMESDVLGQVVRYLEVLRSHEDVSAYIRSKPFQFDPNAAMLNWKAFVNTEQ